MPVDGVPYVGRHDPLSSGVWVATGFRKWGLAMGTAAAELLAAQIARPRTRLGGALRPAARPAEGERDVLREGERERGAPLLRRPRDEARRRGRDRARARAGSWERALGQRAVYRDDDGTLHELSARCTHLGCMSTGTAPSRPGTAPAMARASPRRGEVIEGPAVRPLRSGVLERGAGRPRSRARPRRRRRCGRRPASLLARALEDAGRSWHRPSARPVTSTRLEPARQRRPHDREPLAERVRAQAEPPLEEERDRARRPRLRLARHRVGHRLVELLAREAGEQLGQAVVVEAGGGLEQPLEDAA